MSDKWAMKNEKDEPFGEILTVHELARYLRCHPTTIYRMLKQGKLRAFKIGSDWRFRLDDIRHWCERAATGHSP